jgi:hypothetical protein
VNLTVTNTENQAGKTLDPASQPMSVAQLLEQAAAAMGIKHQATQALAMQHMQQLQAELLATQARLAADNARMSGQGSAALQAEMQKLALLSAAGGWSPLAFAPQNPAAALLQMTTPQFAAAAADQASTEAATQATPSSSMWSSAADAAAQWRDSMSKLFSTSGSWFPWSP